MKSLKLLVVTLSIAMLMAVSACASPPPPIPTPIPVHTPNFTEAEVIELTRVSNVARSKLCWFTGEARNGVRDHDGTRTASASLKKNGLWLVTADSSWTRTELIPVYETEQSPMDTRHPVTGQLLPNARAIRIGDKDGESKRVGPYSCTFLFDDKTGEVLER